MLNGWVINAYTFYDLDSKSCCPITACLIADGVENIQNLSDVEIENLTAKSLKVDPLWVRDFISGFDKDAPVASEAYRLGKEMHNIFVVGE